MNTIKKYQKNIDWLLLIFLVLFTNQAILSLKIIALIVIYFFRPNFKFGSNRIPKFFWIIILISFANLFINLDFSKNYLIAFAVGNLFWVLCFLAYHQFKLSLEKYGTGAVSRTLQLFTLLNFAACLYQLIQIMILTGKLNPYKGLGFPYGMSTGDHIYGIFMGNAYNNLMVSALLTMFFIFRKNILFTGISTICMLLVFGNAGIIIFFAVLICILVLSIRYGRGNEPLLIKNFLPGKGNLLFILYLFFGTVVFYSLVSPENIKYTFERLMMRNTAMANRMNGNEYEKAKLKQTIYINDSSDWAWKKDLTRRYVEHFKGKKLSIVETNDYLLHSMKSFLIGAGTTNFSSLTAQRMSGLDSSRIFTQVLPFYCSPLYGANHRLIHIMRLSDKPEYLSQTNNWPNSVYNQILGEYGIIGGLIFILFYFGYYFKGRRYWSYGLWITLLIIAFSFFDYMFEPLCVMIFYELLMEVDIMANKERLALKNE